MPKVDGIRKLTGEEIYGADAAPEDALWMRVVRSPHARARFALGDMAALYEKYPGLVDVLTERDVPGSNAFGIYPDGKDQPVLASEGAVSGRSHRCARGRAIDDRLDP